MGINDATKTATQIGLKLKKAKKAKQEKITLSLDDAMVLVNSTMILSRINKLAESYIETIDLETQGSTVDKGQAEVWSLILTELEAPNQ